MRLFLIGLVLLVGCGPSVQEQRDAANARYKVALELVDQEAKRFVHLDKVCDDEQMEILMGMVNRGERIHVEPGNDDSDFLPAVIAKIQAVPGYAPMVEQRDRLAKAKAEAKAAEEARDALTE